MKKVALLIEKMCQEAEALVPYYRLQEAGFQVNVVAPEAKTYTTERGYPLTADVAAADARADDYVAVIIPGGFAPDFMRRDPALVGFVRQMASQGKVVAAICHAVWVLAEADVLRGKRCTSFYSMRTDIQNAGGIWEDSPTVVDGNLVTARVAEDLPSFCKTIVAMLEEERALA